MKKFMVMAVVFVIGLTTGAVSGYRHGEKKYELGYGAGYEQGRQDMYNELNDKLHGLPTFNEEFTVFVEETNNKLEDLKISIEEKINEKVESFKDSSFLI